MYRVQPGLQRLCVQGWGDLNFELTPVRRAPDAQTRTSTREIMAQGTWAESKDVVEHENVRSLRARLLVYILYCTVRQTGSSRFKRRRRRVYSECFLYILSRQHLAAGTWTCGAQEAWQEERVRGQRQCTCAAVTVLYTVSEAACGPEKYQTNGNKVVISLLYGGRERPGAWKTNKQVT